MKNKLSRFAVPYEVWMAIFVVAPILIMVIYAFSSSEGGFTLDNFVQMGGYTQVFLRSFKLAIIATLICELFPYPLIAIFGAANESSYYADFAVKAFRTYLCMMVLACVNKACFIFLQAVGKALTSTLLSMFREVVFGVGFALLLPVFFGLDGVLYSMPVSDILTFIISAIIIVKTYRELNVEGVQKV